MEYTRPQCRWRDNPFICHLQEKVQIGYKYIVELCLSKLHVLYIYFLQLLSSSSSLQLGNGNILLDTRISPHKFQSSLNFRMCFILLMWDPRLSQNSGKNKINSASDYRDTENFDRITSIFLDVMTVLYDTLDTVSCMKRAALWNMIVKLGAFLAFSPQLWRLEDFINMDFSCTCLY